MAHRIPNERLLDVFKFTDGIELRYIFQRGVKKVDAIYVSNRI